MESPDTPISDEDLQAITPTPFARAAGGILMVCGLFTALLGVQTLLMVRFTGVVVGIIPLMLALGVSAVAFGWKVMRVRGWAAIAGATTAGLICVLGAVWVVYSFLNGLVSLVALGVVPLAASAAILSALRIAPGKQADAARSRLRDMGFDSGT